MNAENEQTDRTIIIAAIIGAVVSLCSLLMALILDRLDQKHMLIPTFTFTMDDLPKPQPLNAEP